MVVKADPVTNDAAGMQQGFTAVPVSTLLLQSPDNPFNHTVLLRTMRCDEFLSQAMAAHQGRVAATGENEPIVRAKPERRRHPAQRIDFL